MKKIILHIGSGKTGSTSIQRALYECRSLNDHVLKFPVLLNWKNNQVFRFAFCESHKATSNIRNKYVNKQDDYLDFQNAIKKNFTEQVSNHEVVMVSSEFLFMSSQEEALRIKDFLNELGFDEIHVVMYLRDPAKYYLSLAQQSLKSQHKLPSPDNFNYDLVGAINNWSSAQPASLTVKEFDKSKLVEGDVVKDIEQYILSVIEEPITLSLSKQQNESMSVEGTAILQEYHKLLSKCDFDYETRTKYIQRARVFSRVASAGSKPVLKPEIAKYIYGRYETEILKLNQEFGVFSAISKFDYKGRELAKGLIDFTDIVTSFDINDYLNLKGTL
jgi:hypothetical protein